MATHDELDAIEQIKKLKARYFRCMDTKDWDGFQAVFTEDASMDTTQEAPDIEVVVGAPQIRLFVEGSVGPVVTVHHGHMPEIELTGPDTARGTWAMSDYVEWPPSESGERRGLQGYGHYQEEYVREDGQWRIARLHLSRLRIDPHTKRLVFSDGLTVDKAIAIYRALGDHTQLGFGIGTHLSNDVGLQTLNIVMKLTSANGQPVAKLSDSPGKTLCDDATFLAYLRQVFNVPAEAS